MPKREITRNEAMRIVTAFAVQLQAQLLARINLLFGENTLRHMRDDAGGELDILLPTTVLATSIVRDWRHMAVYAVLPDILPSQRMDDILNTMAWMLYAVPGSDDRDEAPMVQVPHTFFATDMGELWVRAYVKWHRGELCTITEAAAMLQTSLANVNGYMNRGDLAWYPDLTDPKQRKLIVLADIEKLLNRK
jgi:hypothetical protein